MDCDHEGRNSVAFFVPFVSSVLKTRLKLSPNIARRSAATIATSVAGADPLFLAPP